jgi:PIN domain nuclease of toxin-antitoxin system
MNLLLDTHVLLWFLADDGRLSRKARRSIAKADEVFVSAASAWEIAIKVRLGKLRFDGALGSAVSGSGLQWLAVTERHAEATLALPALHGDPFDRMLVAQAQREELRLMTHDDKLAAYPVDVMVI